MTGADWVQKILDKIQADEDNLYAAIGAYDPEAFTAYVVNEYRRLTEIADRLTEQGYNWDTNEYN